ncbi:MAG TPA: MFS transporter [Xanthobacteraceae bacterium]|jgi:predicted MFS family arabinose efflux permease|nr:MFS transporter [Xanthobacteraceae bacterium]
MLESRWLILAVLFIARFALGYQFQSAGSVAPFLIRDLDIDYAQVGLLIGAFMLPGVAISVPSGFLVRRFGDKNIVVAGMVLMIVGGVLTGAGQTYAVLLVGRLLSGAGGAVLVVVMLKMIIDWFAARDLFFGMAVFIIGWPIGIAAAQATQSRWAELHPWQSVFFATAGLVAVALLLMLVFYRLPPGAPAPAQAERRRLTRSETGMACLTGAIWMFLNGAYLAMLSFGPSELIERGMSISGADTVVSVMSWVFIIALPLGGYLANRSQAPDAVMVGGLVASIVLGAYLPFSSVPLLSFALFGFALALATPVVAALPARVLAPDQRGPGFGIYYLWYFGGMPVLIALAGLLRDGTGSATASLEFAVAMLVACVALLAVFRFVQGRLA